MSILSVCLFGNFTVHCGEQSLPNLNIQKVQELFSYLLLFRDRPHPRESLANIFWWDNSTVQSKRYLRKTLWQLQTGLKASGISPDNCFFIIKPDWIQLNPDVNIWLDVAKFEGIFNQIQGMQGRDLDQKQVQILQQAIDLYQGDLLEGWYQDWCIYERERFQHIYFVMLDKMMGYCEAHQYWEKGLVYGAIILRYEIARERTHRRLMRLHYLAGDRTAALRQYERCVAALDEELAVKPAKRTVEIYEKIRKDQLIQGRLNHFESQIVPDVPSPHLNKVLVRLLTLNILLAEMQNQVSNVIQYLKSIQKKQH